MSRLSLPFLLASCLSTQVSAAPQALGSIEVSKPTFLQVLPAQAQEPASLIISSFGESKGGTLSRLPFSSQSLENLSELKPSLLSERILWPNQAISVPVEIFGPNYLLVSSGWHAEGFNGAITVKALKSDETVVLSQEKAGYFYHKTIFHDMNEDGRLDAVTARAKIFANGATDGELLWLEQPQGDPRGRWQEHVIAKGPDVQFALLDIDADGSPEVLATEFFSEKLSLHWQEGKLWKNRTIDADLGRAFEIDIADLNGDGRKDVLVSNHQADSRAAVFAYEIPQDFRAASWPKHVLLEGIKTEKSGPGQSSPGAVLAVQPDAKNLLKKPLIVVGGDGSTKVHLLHAKSDEAHDWQYREEILLDTDSIIGHLNVGDVNADGRLELFVPAYNADKIFVFQL